MKYFDIVTPKKYTDKDGQEKTKWLTVGAFRETDDGKRFVQWNVTPEITYMVVDPKSKATDNEDQNKEGTA